MLPPVELTDDRVNQILSINAVRPASALVFRRIIVVVVVGRVNDRRPASDRGRATEVVLHDDSPGAATRYRHASTYVYVTPRV